jgi:hypothetical protein
MTKNHREPTYDSLYSWKLISVMGLMAGAMLVSFISPYFLEKRRRVQEDWPQSPGTSIDTRIVEEPPQPRFPIRLYVGQCLVEYSVSGKRYTVWAGAGYLDRDRAFVADRITVCPISRFVVHYNPRDPSEAFARRWDGPN